MFVHAMSKRRVTEPNSSHRDRRDPPIVVSFSASTVTDKIASVSGNWRPSCACIVARSARAFVMVTPGLRRPITIYQLFSRARPTEKLEGMGDHKSVSRAGNRNDGGITPTMG